MEEPVQKTRTENRTCLSLKFIAKKFIDVLCLIELITKDTNWIKK